MRFKKKAVILVLLSLFLLVATAAPALANPPEGAITENPRKTIVRDPLAPTGADPDALGWVVFVCESVEGFQYSISVKGLAPNTTYSVGAVAQAWLWVGPGPGDFVPTSDPGATYALGTIRTNGKGEGKLDNGFVPLPAWNDALGMPVGIYAWAVEVTDSSGTTVLVAGIDPLFGPDYNDFIVFPYWGFPLPL